MRVKSPRLHRHKKILRLAKGYRMTKHRLYKVAHEAVIHAGQYAYAGRRIRRRDFRRLWIVRIHAALSQFGINYSSFISALKKSNIVVDRKIMADLAVKYPHVFKALVTSSGLLKK